ncbi:MAG: tetratricopeptide repeat protein [Alphaproteobacteria bacterium]|nr:tetratricopeptide repeat protein [Alphaproteobacteria bacterium]
MARGKALAPDGSSGGAAPLTRQQRRQQARQARKGGAGASPGKAAAPRDSDKQDFIVQAIQRATQDIQSGAFRSGLELIEQVLRLAPDHAEAIALKGNLAYIHGNYETAIALFRQSLAIEGRAPFVLFNLGAVLVKAGRYTEAIEPLRRAIKLEPGLAQAHNALGGAYVALWRFDEAKRALNKALSLPGPKAPACTNLGIAHLGLGDAEAAIGCFAKSLRLKADPRALYDGLLPAAGVLALADDPDMRAAWPTAKQVLREVNPASPGPDLVDYALETLKVDPASDALARAQALLPPVDQETVALAAPEIAKPASGGAELPRRVCALYFFGRSATGLLHALVDGHPQVTTLPGVYFKGFFGPGVWEGIRHSDADEMISRFMDVYEVFFDARHPKSVPGNPSKGHVSMGAQEGFVNMGPNRDQVLTVDKSAFRAHMKALLAGRERLTQGDFFLMLHRAFERAQGKPGDEELVFYHIHNPLPHEVLNFFRHFPDSQLLMMVREPLRSCESWISGEVLQDSDYLGLGIKLAHMPFQISRPEFRGRDARGLRLDDLKLRPEASMRALAHWLGIGWNPSLLTPTMQGLAWWGNPGSKTFGADPFDPAVLTREVGEIFRERDQRVLRALYYPFRVLYGWEQDNPDAFRALLAEAPELLENPLDCEHAFADTLGIPVTRLTQSVSFRYIRLALRLRLEALAKHGTCPGMIEPLEIAD